MFETNVRQIQEVEGKEKRVEQKRWKWQKGFTLIEVLAVTTILVIVAGIGFVVVNNQIATSRENTDVANVRTIADAVQRYLMDHPNDGAELDNTDVTDTHVLITGGYLARAPQDPWDAAASYHIDVDGRNVIIRDRSADQDHDITLTNVLP